MKKILLLVGGAAVSVALGYVVLKVAMAALRKVSESVKDDEDLSFEEMMVGFAEMPPATPFLQ